MQSEICTCFNIDTFNLNILISSVINKSCTHHVENTMVIIGRIIYLLPVGAVDYFLSRVNQMLFVFR